MKTMIKRFMAVVCAMTLTLSLVACGAENASGEGGSASIGAGTANTGSTNVNTNGTDSTGKENTGTGEVTEEVSGDWEWKLVQEDDYRGIDPEKRLPLTRVEYEYDDKGNLIKETYSGANRSPEGISYQVTSFTEYKYNDLGQNIWKQETETNGIFTEYTWYEMEYAEDGTISKGIYGGGSYKKDGAAIDTWKKEQVAGKDGEVKSNITYKIEADGSEWINSRTEKNENGETIYSWSYSAPDTISEGFEYEFDEQGRKTSYVYYPPRGSVEKTTYTYNDAGLLVSEYKSFGEKGEDGSIVDEKFANSVVHEYDANGQLIKSISYNREYQDGINPVGWTECEYDEQGNCVRKTKYDRGRITWQHEYVYDENGNKIMDKDYLSDGRVICSEYDQQENEIKKIWYLADGNIEKYQENTYNASGNYSYILFNSDGTIDSGYDNEYDQYGNVTKSVKYKNGAIEGYTYTEYEYATDGTILKKTTKTGENGENISSCYEIDVAGNVLQDLYYVDGEIQSGYQKAYDANGNVLEYKKYDDFELSNWNVKEYDNNLLVSSKSMSKEGTVLSESIYTYDEYGNQTEIIRKGGIGGDVSYVYTYEKIKIAK